ncbi:hypothetical protein BUALT_Bualt14G0055100 [Buddleja alternifolia]|uniref:Uncharacterized protein n=1 Tax=Buddleja alternifolia TaxID=168488 RepID=A0AAV6WF65_9LAMI|nr:hypothetical protein BUALT_Bualt14G0055100 [Buddleja alternifolia]
MVRPACVDKSGLKKGEWSEEEDNKLRAYILRYGHWNWRLLPKYADLQRSGKSCRLRWVNYLKPGLKLGDYSKEEKDLIRKLHDELGNKWSAIAAKLPGRTDSGIKNYWHTHLKKPCSKRSRAPSESSESCNHANILQDKLSSDQKIPRNIANIPTFSQQLQTVEASSCVMHSLESSISIDQNLLDSSVEQNLLSGSNSVGIKYGENDDDSASSNSDSIFGFQQDFWTQPFVVDTSYNQGCNFSLLDAEGFLAWSDPFGLW